MRASPRNSALTLVLFALLITVPAHAAGSIAARGTRSPIAIALTGDRIYVADFDNDRIQVFTRTGEALLGWGRTGSEPGQFRGPAGVAIAADGSVFVTDHYNHRIQRFTADGTYMASWSAGGDDAAPFGVAVDRRERVYVTDLEAGRVGVWRTDGTSLATWGSRGHEVGEMDEPWGIAVDAQGDVFVADHGNDRVQRFSSEGNWLGEWSRAAVDEARLIGPMGLAIGRDGSVYATDLAGDRLGRFTRDGDLVAMWRGAEASAESPAFGIALDAGGDVFLVDPGRQQIVRVPAAQIMSPVATPAAFAMMPIAQPLGRGPVTLDFAIPGPGTIGAEIFSIDGRRVHEVPGAACDAGTYRITWDAVTDDGHRAPVGMYFVRVQFDDGASRITRSGRVVVLR
jgi:NHL repeat-containing protein/flagellar hook capping protein FlgD